MKNAKLDFSKMVAYDYSNIDFQNLDPANCFGTCDSCDASTGGCNCDCDSNDCDCNEY